MAELKPRRCRECGDGTIRLIAKAGRRAPYRNMMAIELPSSLEIPTCDHCGSEWIDEPTAVAMEEVLKVRYCEELRNRLQVSIKRILDAVPDASQREIERLLGLSQGYFSRLMNERGEPSPRVVSTLALVAQDPANRLRELQLLWSPEFI